MEYNKTNKTIQVDGYEISVSFSNNPNTAVINQVKQILLSSFIASTSKPKSDGILAI